MTESGAMVSTNLEVDPIVPLGMLAVGGCKISWKKHGVKVSRPTKGSLPISIQAGCPQNPKQLALELIKEYEERTQEVKQARLVGETQPQVEGHPALAELPVYMCRRLWFNNRGVEGPSCQSASTKTVESSWVSCATSLCGET